MNAREAAEAVSEGVNALEWLVTRPRSDLLRASLAETTTRFRMLRTALEAVSRGDFGLIAKSRIDQKMLTDLSLVEEDLSRGEATESTYAAASRIVSNLAISQLVPNR
jgi:hypothetical protein